MRHTFARLSCVVVGLLLLCGGASAQTTTASLSGTVTDQNRAVVAGAAVKARSEADGRTTIAQTDGAGGYRLEGLKPGSYRVSVVAAGFETLTREVELSASGAAGLDFALGPAWIAETMTVTVGKGSARAASDTPQTVVVADERRIELRRPASTLEAVEQTPNLTPVGANPAGARPRLRGLASNRLLLVVDGERLNNVRSDPLSGVSPSVIDVTHLQSAEVVNGPESSLYGSDALAGVINLVTKSPAPSASGQTFGLRFDGDYHSNGAFRRGAATLNWSAPRVALRLGGSYFREASYGAGDGAVTIEDVLRLGGLANDMGNAAGNNVARTYAVWQLPAGATIPNGQGHGFNDHVGLWLFLNPRHSLRYRQVNSQHDSLGFPALAPPLDPRNQYNGFRRLDKYGVRYEGEALSRRVSRVAAGFYRQKYSFADDNVVSTISAGSSWQVVPDASTPTGTRTVLTGRPSAFAPGSFTSGKSSVTSYGLEGHATIVAPLDILFTTGVGYLRDSSRDEFARVDFAAGGARVGGRAGNPDAVYENLGWFNLIEYDARPWLRLTGGLRVDRWTTRAAPTEGFPLGTEAAILAASFERLAANPGSVNVEGARGIVNLLEGGGGVGTRNNVVTGSVGVLLRLPGGFNPYFRWGNTYREPGITERYILRDFGDPTFSVLLVSNTALRPEKGRSIDAGVKVKRRRVAASLNYFRNDFEDFLRPVFSPALFVPADPARGLLPVSPFFPFHGVLYVQRANTARARIHGFEAALESALPLGRAGALAPFATLGWLKGSDLTPDPSALDLIGQFYNRADTPVPLSGSATDAPLAGITPFRGMFGLRYRSPGDGWFAEYELRTQGRVLRADPLELSAAVSTQYGTFAGLNSFARQSVRFGYVRGAEEHRMLLTFGVENLTDRFYFEHFQTAPAPGRSFVFGLTLDFNWRR